MYDHSTSLNLIMCLYKVCCSHLAVTKDLPLEVSPLRSSINESSLGLVVRSISSTSTLQVTAITVVTESNTDNFVLTSATTQLPICSQSITTAGK